jgi:hypothetical protein
MAMMIQKLRGRSEHSGRNQRGAIVETAQRCAIVPFS